MRLPVFSFHSPSFFSAPTSAPRQDRHRCGFTMGGRGVRHHISYKSAETGALSLRARKGQLRIIKPSMSFDRGLDIGSQWFMYLLTLRNTFLPARCSLISYDIRTAYATGADFVRTSQFSRRFRSVLIKSGNNSIIFAKYLVDNRNFAIFVVSNNNISNNEVHRNSQQVQKGRLEVRPRRGKPLLLYKGRRNDRTYSLPWGSRDAQVPIKQTHQEVRDLTPYLLKQIT